MTGYVAGMLAVASALCFGSIAHAADAEFLKSLDGDWAGKGSVKPEADSSPISVNCKFASDTTDTTRCRSMASARAWSSCHVRSARIS